MLYSFCLLVLLAAVATSEVTYDKDVMVLDADNFDEVISSNPFVLVEFYAPWCGHCKNLAPKYAEAAKVLRNIDTPVPLGMVDADNKINKGLASRYKVSGFPTLKWFVNGEAKEFQGGRTKDAIVDWVMKKTGPAVTTVSSVEEAKKYLSDNEEKVVAFGFFSDVEGPNAVAFSSVASDMDDVTFVWSADAAVFAEFDAEDGAVVVFRNFDEPRVPYSGDFEAEALKTFLNGASVPTVLQFTQDSANTIFKVTKNVLLFADDEANYKTFEEKFSALAKTNKERDSDCIFVWFDGSDSEYDRAKEFFGVTETPALRFLVNVDGDMSKYRLEEEVTNEAIEEFVNNFYDGKLSKWLKTQDIPEANDEPVKVLVGKSFNDIVFDSAKDVFVEFYAPWCGHCKSLAPIWDELAEKFGDDESLVIAKMDSTENEVDHPDINVQGFPTLKWFPKGEENKVVDYEGGRTLEDFEKFLAKEHVAGEVADEKEEL